MIRLHELGSALGLILLATAPSAAQESQKSDLSVFKQLKGNQDIFAYDFGVPLSPAMLLLGIQGGSLAPSSTLKAFVGQIGNVVGGSGQSFAMEITPAALTNGRQDVGRYMEDRGLEGKLYRLVRRAHIGVAGVLGSAGEKPVQSGVSLGFTVALLDSSDPLRSRFLTGDKAGTKTTLQECIITESNIIAPLAKTTDGVLAPSISDPTFGKLDDLESRVRGAINGTFSGLQSLLTPEDRVLLAQQGIVIPTDAIASNPREGLIAFNVLINQKKREVLNRPNVAFAENPMVKTAIGNINACAKKASNAAAYGTDLTIGGGTFWRGKPGEFSELKNGGGAVWAALRTSFHTEWTDDSKTKPSAAWLVGVSSRYGIRETIATGDKTVANIRADTLDGWAGIERRSPDFLASARIGYQQVRANEAAGRFFNRQGTRFLLNAQQRVTDQMWLSLSYGNAGGSVDTYNAKRFLVSVAFSPPKPDNIVGTKD